MANIRVTCPTCQTDLEIDAEFEGQEVECGNCLQVFVAQPTSSSGSRSASSSRRKSEDAYDDDDDRPKKKKKKKKRKLDWDDHDDDDDDYDSSSRDGPNNTIGIISLVLGILSIVVAIGTICCCPFAAAPLSIGAIVTGVVGMNNPDSKAMSIAGLVMGGLSLALCVVVLAVTGLQMQNGNRFR